MVKYTIEKKPHHHAIEWAATFLSIVGAFMVSLQHFQGYYIWIAANILWFIFSFKYKHHGLLTLSIAHFIINGIGILKWQFGFNVFG